MSSVLIEEKPSVRFCHTIGTTISIAMIIASVFALKAIHRMIITVATGVALITDINGVIKDLIGLILYESTASKIPTRIPQKSPATTLNNVKNRALKKTAVLINLKKANNVSVN